MLAQVQYLPDSSSLCQIDRFCVAAKHRDFATSTIPIYKLEESIEAK